MPEYVWPAKSDATVIGKPIDRIDGLEKSTGAAKYSYDINPEKMLIAKALGSPHAHAEVKSIDTSAAEKVPGVVHVHVMPLMKPADGSTPKVQFQGELIAVVAAETEGAAAEGVAAIKVEHQPAEVFVEDEDLEAAKTAGRTSPGGGQVKLPEGKEAPAGEDAEAFAQKEIEGLLNASDVVVQGRYGIHAITHMCLEPHGSTCEWSGDKLTSHLSTQAVSNAGTELGRALGITANELTIHCDFIGGGFGSKFAADTWGIACAQISKATGRPVKFMLDRDQELKIAGARPSGFLDVKVGADKEGVVKVWDSHHWGTAGITGPGVNQNIMPYVYVPPVYRRRATNIKTNLGPSRAWRAPGHPQACAMSQTVYDDIAAKLGIDSYDVFMRNLPTVNEARRSAYEEEMKIGAKLIDWKAKWHAHGKGPAKGSVVSGLGMGIHFWGGGGHASNCDLKIHPDGGVEVYMGSQDLGTGTRTVIAQVIAETLGLKVEAVKVNIGSSKYPTDGTSGGSTTVGGVSESSRRAGQDALEKFFPIVAEKLQAEASTLEAKDGRIGVKGQRDKSLSWKEACSLLAMRPLEVRGTFDPRQGRPLSNNGVAGVQMAEVEVDKETGVVKMKKFVAVQDMGLVINPKTAASQIYGAVIMGIAYALFEERIVDKKTGEFVNVGLADYKLPRLGDIGEIVVEIYEPESERKRGVIGLGEPPVIAPGAAISNAVANALGVRVPVLPLTPKRVLDAIKNKKTA